MSYDVRTFKAATVDDAIAQIRREMGLDAIVVETKQVARRGLWPLFAPSTEVEVLAQRPSRSASLSANSTAATTASKANVSSIATLTTQTSASSSSHSAARPGTATKSRPMNSSNAPVESVAHTNSRTTTAPSHAIRQTERTSTPQLSESWAKSLPHVEPAATAPAIPVDIEQRLDSLQQMIAELGRRTRPRGLTEIPPELFSHYLTLIEADVDDEMARDLMARLQQHATPGQLSDTASTTALLAALIERELRCEEPLALKRGCRQVAMLVGPTGVGKTTTIAKLAGRFGLTDDLRVGLITVDTYRVAAVDQLRTYAEIIDLPMQVVSGAEELPSALAKFEDFDLVLIDTAGRSPQDERRLHELKQLVDAARPDHVYLVLSLASGLKSLCASAERFAAARPTSLIVTKLDEAEGCGALLSLSRNIALPICYLTSGQEVPRDMEPANPCRAARLILGRERLNRSDMSSMNHP